MRKIKKLLKYQNNGITLISIVITIIILLILVSISISTLTNIGTFEKAKEAKENSEQATKNQQSILSEYEKTLNENSAEKLTFDKLNTVLSTKKNTYLKDENGNMIVVPAGFKILVDDTTDYKKDETNSITVDKGIVIEDATLKEDGSKTSTNGSQFVWIPVGTITKIDGTIIEIDLNRYTFSSDGTPIAQNEKAIPIGDHFFQELDTPNSANVAAKNIKNFKNSSLVNGGFYIGRYEARTPINRNSPIDSLTQITEKGTESVYNYVTPFQATKLSQEMYDTNHPFTTDLTNSYAWDTTLLFLQKCGKNSKYALSHSLNTSFSRNGTNSSEYIGDRDTQCNIYDMASNLYEWTTETCSLIDYPSVNRGGDYNYIAGIVSGRGYFGISSSNITGGFRPILYL